MLAKEPKTGKHKFFIDKCLPFGASISCAIFQRFSNALTHITKWRIGNMTDKEIANYLDDFLDIALTRTDCNLMLTTFQETCDSLNIPLAKEKTVWATVCLVFLGILLNGERLLLTLPQEKIRRTVHLLELFLQKKKATVKEVQSLAGLLNFLHKAIYPGCAFTRRMYAKVRNLSLKPYHHINLDREFRNDCKVWLKFLNGGNVEDYCRPFMDLKSVTQAEEVGFYTDSSAGAMLGFGGIYGDANWFFGQWEPGYIKNLKPSIEYLELYAVCTGLFIFSSQIRDRQLAVHCDNMAVVGMLNSTTSSCKRCMHLIRMIVLRSLKYNFRIFAVYVNTKVNDLADSLSRLQFDRFRKLTKGTPRHDTNAEQLLEELWPALKIWDSYKGDW